MSTLEIIAEHAAKLPEPLRLELLKYLLFLEEKSGISERPWLETDEKRRTALREAFSALERRGTFSEITDLAAWQRELRRDRPLPGREK